MAGLLASFKAEGDLARLAAALIEKKAHLTDAEHDLIETAHAPDLKKADVNNIRKMIAAGNDPLGELFLAIRSAENRRSDGAVYTPNGIVQSMVRWVSAQGDVERLVDPGSGSGRYILAAARDLPNTHFIAVEKDPLAALLLRANLSVRDLMSKATVVVDDFRNLDLAGITGKTAFLGNPPYVRHHEIGEDWKRWYVDSFAARGIKASALAGLHLHFFLKVSQLAQQGDVGAFITSAEWMDVNYGSALRSLLADGLGLESLHVLEPSAEAFPGTATTAAISCFHVGNRKRTIRSRSVVTLDGLNGLSKGRTVAKKVFRQASKWSSIVTPSEEAPGDFIELGEFFRVHRGQVTGKNEVWVASEAARDLPERVLFPSVTKAKDLIFAGARLTAADLLRCVVDLPPELDEFTTTEKRRIADFLRWAKSLGADSSYIATHRKAWWSVGLKPPAPILCTYMARRPPQFTLNECRARHINIAHGLYPRDEMEQPVLAAVVDWLNKNVKVGAGRTYAGGLTKFEPKEIERLKIPNPASLNA